MTRTTRFTAVHVHVVPYSVILVVPVLNLVRVVQLYVLATTSWYVPVLNLVRSSYSCAKFSCTTCTSSSTAKFSCTGTAVAWIALRG